MREEQPVVVRDGKGREGARVASGVLGAVADGSQCCAAATVCSQYRVIYSIDCSVVGCLIFQQPLPHVGAGLSPESEREKPLQNHLLERRYEAPRSRSQHLTHTLAL